MKHLMEPTYCSECDHVHNPKDHSSRWQCIKFPKLEGNGFVTKNYRDGDLYNRCQNINTGFCPLFTPKRTTEKEE